MYLSILMRPGQVKTVVTYIADIFIVYLIYYLIYEVIIHR